MSRFDPLRARWRRASRSTWLVVAATIALHAFLWPRIFAGARLPHAAYFEAVPLARIFDRRTLLVLLAVHAAWVLAAGRKMSWRRIDPRRRARLLVTGTAAIFALTIATYSYNFYYDQGFLLDRLLVLALGVLVWLHPAWVLPFLVAMLALAHQTLYPLPEAAWAWPDKRLPLDFLVLFVSYLYVRTVTRPRRHVVLVLALALTGAVYSHAAITKLGFGPAPWSWVVDNELSNLVVSSFLTSGWLRPLGEATVLWLAKAADPWDPLLQGLTLVLELAGFAVLLRGRLTRYVLAGFVVMHTGILLASGIFFWKWIVFDLLLLWYFDAVRRDSGPAAVPLRGPYRIDRRLFAPATVALVLLVVAGTRFYFYNVPFAWWDTRLANQVRLQAVTASGERYPIDGRSFAPYDVLFVQSRFYYLVDVPVLAGTFGTCRSYPLFTALERATPEDLPGLRGEYGRVLAVPAVRPVFAAFVRRFVTNAIARRGEGLLLEALAPPFHFQGTPPADAFDFAQPIERVDVVWEETFYDGDEVVPVVRGLVMSIPLAGGAPGGEGDRPPAP